MTSPQQDLIEALDALRDLVHLKQGPRDTHYRESKQPAWDRAAAIVEKIDSKQQALATFDQRRQAHSAEHRTYGEAPSSDTCTENPACILGQTHTGNCSATARCTTWATEPRPTRCDAIAGHLGPHEFHNGSPLDEPITTSRRYPGQCRAYYGADEPSQWCLKIDGHEDSHDNGVMSWGG